MTACLSAPIYAAMGVTVVAVLATTLGFQIGRAVGTVEESQAEEKQAEILNDVLSFAEDLPKEKP